MIRKFIFDEQEIKKAILAILVSVYGEDISNGIVKLEQVESEYNDGTKYKTIIAEVTELD